MMAQQHWQADIVAIADAGLLKQRATELNLHELIPYGGAPLSRQCNPGQLLIKHVPLAETAIAGALNVALGQYVVETLSIASDGNLSGEFDAIVTEACTRSIINEAGVAFSGHTEFFANKADCPDVVMMLATEGLRVALAYATHIPLAYVSKRLHLNV